MAQLDDSWRPDRSKIIVRLYDGDGGGLVFQPLGKASELLTTEKVLSVVGGCVASGIPVYISVRTKPDRCHALLLLSGDFANAVASRVLVAAQYEMLKALEHAYQIETDPILPLDETNRDYE
jgi:hypothetical protein